MGSDMKRFEQKVADCLGVKRGDRSFSTVPFSSMLGENIKLELDR